MATPNISFDVPYRDKLTGKGGFLTNAWQWFFRAVWERLYPLGIERSFKLVTNINAKTFTTGDINTSTDVVTYAGHGYYTGLVGQLTTTGSLPGGLSASTDYYIIKVSDNTFKFATSEANADAGSAVNITSVGSGNHTFTPAPPVTGLKFNPNGVTQAIVEYLIQRITTGGSAVELTEAGVLMFAYNPSSENWSKITVSEENPDDAGVDFLINSNGQVTYTTTGITGSASISIMFWRARTLSGKNAQFSGVGAR